ncbi:MAG TPA: hypothetical protein DCZ76_00800 [Treponema sp.]|nr:hypothetical protein [Treponema sp.]
MTPFAIPILRPIGGARGCMHPVALLTESVPELVEGPMPAAMEPKGGTPESGEGKRECSVC